jgi:hypothetical protein
MAQQQLETKDRSFEPWRLKLPPLMLECLATENSRYTLMRPFVVGDYIYTTDGRVCARTRASDDLRPLIPDETRIHPPVEATFAEWSHQTAMPTTPVPYVPRTDRTIVCENCARHIRKWGGLLEIESKGEYDVPLAIAVRFKADRDRYISGAILRRLYPHDVYLAFKASDKDMQSVYFRSKSQPVDGLLMPLDADRVVAPDSYTDIIVDAETLAAR